MPKLLTLTRDLRRRKARERLRLFVAEGVRTVEELLRSPLQLHGALVDPSLEGSTRGSALLGTLAARNVQVTHVTEAELASAADTESPQGILAIGHMPEYDLVSLRVPPAARILVLDGVQDPGNVGTLVRTAAAFGAIATVALPGTVDLFNAKVVRSAMGSIFHHAALHATGEQLSEFLHRSDTALWGADAAGHSLEAEVAPSRLAIALGNEGAGLSAEVRTRADRLVALPISPDVDSLNVAVAGGILLYELRP